jgi:hypothetical protein
MILRNTKISVEKRRSSDARLHITRKNVQIQTSRKAGFRKITDEIVEQFM